MQKPVKTGSTLKLHGNLQWNTEPGNESTGDTRAVRQRSKQNKNNRWIPEVCAGPLIAPAPITAILGCYRVTLPSSARGSYPSESELAPRDGLGSGGSDGGARGGIETAGMRSVECSVDRQNASGATDCLLVPRLSLPRSSVQKNGR